MMNNFVTLFFLVFFCFEANAKLYKFNVLNGLRLFGETNFDNYKPFYTIGKVTQQAFPDPYNHSPDTQYPVSFFFNSCTHKKLNADFKGYLKGIPDKKTLTHFILILPCTIGSQKASNEAYFQFRNYLDIYVHSNAVDVTKMHLITFQENSSFVLKLVETYPEIFTSVTLINAMPPLDHLTRYRGVRIRGYVPKSSDLYSNIVSGFEKLKRAQVRAELIELNDSPEDIIKNSIGSEKHWKWISSLAWGN